MSRDGVDIRSEKPMRRADGGASSSWSDRDDGLSLTLTTHRVFFLQRMKADVRSDLGGLSAQFVHLSAVVKFSPEGGPTLFSPKATYKILLSTQSYGEIVLVFRGPRTAPHRSKLDRDDFLSAMEKATKRRAWEESARADRKKKDSASTKIASRKVGVDAILTKNALKHKEAARLTDEAFGSGDVEKLMREAGEMVAIIKRYALTLERSQEKKEGDDEADAKKLTGMLEDMGMTSALTKEQAIRGGGEGAYYQTLARQLSDFLRRRDRLKEAGGMMTLTDVYCLFNRARGTNMISPEDLLKATYWMGELRLGVKSRKFPSGVVVLQEDGFDDEVVAKALVDLANTIAGGGITVLDASKSLKVSAILADEQLLSAERMGYLCRDTTLEGMRFFQNRFATGEFDGW